jgi:hypothetical protein
MARYLVEVPHEAEKVACANAIRVFLETGSHFLANAEWGCSDGEHKAWLILDVETKDDARSVLPPNFRSKARIVGLNRFTLQQVDQILSEHQG